MKKRDAFDSLLAAAGADPFKFGPKSMNQIREQQQKQQPTVVTEVQTFTYSSSVSKQSDKDKDKKPQPSQKFRQPSIDISGLEDLDSQSNQNTVKEQAATDVFDVFSDVGATEIRQQSEQSSPELSSPKRVSMDFLPSQNNPSDAIAVKQEKQDTHEGFMHLSKSTPNIQHMNDIGMQQTQRQALSSPPTPPNEPEDIDVSPALDEEDATLHQYVQDEHELQNVVLPSRARQQGGAREVDADGLKNMWNGLTKSAKNFSKNISKKMNEFVATPSPTSLSVSQKQPAIPQNQSASYHTQVDIQEYQEFLAIAVAKMPSEQKRKMFISRLESDDREAVLAVFREQRHVESQSRSNQQSQQVVNKFNNNQTQEDQRTFDDQQTKPSNLVDINRRQHTQTKPSNLVDINHDDNRSTPLEGNFLNVMDDVPNSSPAQQQQQYRQGSAQSPQNLGSDSQDFFSFSDQNFVEFNSTPAPNGLGEDPLAELLGVVGQGQRQVGSDQGLDDGMFFGGDLMDVEDEDLVQLVNQKCEELAVPGEPIQRKEFRRIRLMQEAKQVREKMLWKQDMEEREEKAKQEKSRVKEEIMEEIKQWKNESTGIQGYLCNLHKVLWAGADWKPMPLSELLEQNKVKKAYLKAQLVVHPDKVNQKFDGNPPPEIAARADMIADILKESMAKFS